MRLHALANRDSLIEFRPSERVPDCACPTSRGCIYPSDRNGYKGQIASRRLSPATTEGSWRNYGRIDWQIV